MYKFSNYLIGPNIGRQWKVLSSPFNKDRLFQIVVAREINYVP